MNIRLSRTTAIRHTIGRHGGWYREDNRARRQGATAGQVEMSVTNGDAGSAQHNQGIFGPVNLSNEALKLNC